ncbi:MAG: hypothetical protein KF805_07410 [Phycisphaeraceae bacterium]|nr:hypothetical protein [Phycisphaeraceae bacterium]
MNEPSVVVSQSQPCISCGYDLLGLSTFGQCPECATPVERSLRGDLLQYSSDEYRRALLRGVTLIMTGIALSLISFVAMFALAAIFGPGASIVFAGLSLVASGASYIGYYLYSTPDPGQLSTNKGERPRRILRVCIAISLVAGLLQIALGLFGPASVFTPASMPGSTAAFLSIATSIAGVVAWIVQFFAALLYTRWLAPRIPNPRLFKRAKLLMWLGPVLMLGYCLIIPPLVAMIMYYNMFSWIRKDLIALRDGIPFPSPEPAQP